jgi:glycosyltransferase involved in cell wall biosynthesis
MKIIITIPAYNEEETIGKVINEIPRRIEGIDRIDVLVINDGSTDNTVEEALKAGADKIVSHKKNLGLGISFRDGLEEGLKMGAGIIVNIDADFQYNAKEIPRLIEPIVNGKADMVLGDRQIDELDHMPMGKKLGNKLATWVTRKVTGLPIKDAQTGFRAFTREAALRMNLTSNYTYVQETLIQAANKNLTVEQIPIEFREREGKSRLISSLFGYAKSAGNTIIRSYRDYQPFKVFTVMGIAIIVIGLITGFRVLIHYFATGMVTPYLPSAVLTTVLIIVGLQVIVLGWLADMLKTQRMLEEEILYLLKK